MFQDASKGGNQTSYHPFSAEQNKIIRFEEADKLEGRFSMMAQGNTDSISQSVHLHDGARRTFEGQIAGTPRLVVNLQSCFRQ